MGAYKFMNLLSRRKSTDGMRFLARIRTWELRQRNTIFRRRKPSRIDRARRVGYKAKPGYVIFSCKVRRGGRKKPCGKGIVYGKPTNHGINERKLRISHQAIAEQRVGRRCRNLRVLNSYWVAEDSSHKWFDVLLVDPWHKRIRNDPRINWICRGKHKHRECRGKTSAGRKFRGIKKGRRYNKNVPSKFAVWKKHNTLRLKRYR